MLKLLNKFRPPIKQRKPPAPEPNYPKCKAIYEYTAADSDEISFKEDDLIYIVKEGMTTRFRCLKECFFKRMFHLKILPGGGVEFAREKPACFLQIMCKLFREHVACWLTLFFSLIYIFQFKLRFNKTMF